MEREDDSYPHATFPTLSFVATCKAKRAGANHGLLGCSVFFFSLLDGLAERWRVRCKRGGRARLNLVPPKTKRRKDVQRVGMTKDGALRLRRCFMTGRRCNCVATKSTTTSDLGRGSSESLREAGGQAGGRGQGAGGKVPIPLRVTVGFDFGSLKASFFF